MLNLRTVSAAALGLGLAIAAPGLATAETAAPQDRRIDLGQQQGDVYATLRADGLHVVATFAEADGAAVPVRFESVLAPGQTVTVSSPRVAGEPANTVAITRQADQLIVRKVPAID